MRLILSLTIGFLFISLISANYICEGCQCSNRDDTVPLKRADRAPICIHFVQDNVTATATKASFAVGVDDFSAVVVNHAQEQFVFPNNGSAVTTHYRIIVQTDNAHSSTALPFVDIVNGVPQFYANLYNIVIRIDDGKVTELIWDNVCGLCSGLTCNTTILEDNTPTNLCDVSETCNGKDYVASCDPKLYITWVGTDVDGTPMISAGMRLSQFVQYSISGLYYEAQGLVNNAVTSVENAVTPAS